MCRIRSRILIQFRTTDIITLIQTLSRTDHTFLDHDAIVNLIRTSPISSESWLDISNQHPEFFRLNGARTHMAILYRSNLPITPQQGINDFRRTLENEEISNLIDQVFKLHSSEIESWQRNSHRIPLYAALISSISIFLIALINTFSQSHANNKLEIKIDSLINYVKTIKTPTVK